MAQQPNLNKMMKQLQQAQIEMAAAQIIEPIVAEARQQLRRTHDVGEADDDRSGHEPPSASPQPRTRA